MIYGMTDWKNIPDDELDEILRRSAESYTPPFDEAAWKEVSDKLITDRKKIIRIRTFSYLLTGLFLAAVLTFLITNNPAPVLKTDKTAGKNTLPEKEEHSHSKTQKPSLPTDKTVITSAPTGQEENSHLKMLKPSLPTDKPIITNSHSGKEENSIHSKTLTLPLQNETTVVKKRSLKPEEPKPRLAEKSSPENNIQSNDESYRTALKFTTQNIKPLTPKEIIRTSPALNLPGIAVPPLTETSPAPLRQSGLGLRVLYSPDFSTIETNKIFKVGNNIGVLGEYRFNKRWSVQTGVIKSLKYYRASPEQYASPYALKNLKDIHATCDMLDIPLNLRFDFVNTPQHKWFVTAGATSYLMLKEKYSYNYENNYGSSTRRNSWEGKTGFYPFGVVNISAGYERRLFKNFTAQAEPFFKVPVQNVGYGNVKLSTFGLFISGKIEFPTQPRQNVRRIRF